MHHKIYPVASRRVIEIWHYTDKNWGDKQADKYVRGLYKAIEDAAINKYLWRKVEHEDVKGIFFVRYEHHFVFFRELSPTFCMKAWISPTVWKRNYTNNIFSIYWIIMHPEQKKSYQAMTPEQKLRVALDLYYSAKELKKWVYVWPLIFFNKSQT